jgi:hypothetical protein
VLTTPEPVYPTESQRVRMRDAVAGQDVVSALYEAADWETVIARVVEDVAPRCRPDRRR